jgi:hypothetical protein
VRRLAFAALLALAVLAPGALAHGGGTTIGTGLREYRVSLYRGSVRPGVVRFTLHNFGEDPHDLAVKRLGHRYGKGAQILPGDSGVLRVRLTKPGRYTVYCTLAGHAAKGMKAILRVR